MILQFPHWKMEDKRRSCFDKLSTNGKSLTIVMPTPFALSLSKGEACLFAISKRIPMSVADRASSPLGGGQQFGYGSQLLARFADFLPSGDFHRVDFFPAVKRNCFDVLLRQ